MRLHRRARCSSLFSLDCDCRIASWVPSRAGADTMATRTESTIARVAPERGLVACSYRIPHARLPLSKTRMRDSACQQIRVHQGGCFRIPPTRNSRRDARASSCCPQLETNAAGPTAGSSKDGVTCRRETPRPSSQADHHEAAIRQCDAAHRPCSSELAHIPH